MRLLVAPSARYFTFSALAFGGPFGIARHARSHRIPHPPVLTVYGATFPHPLIRSFHRVFISTDDDVLTPPIQNFGPEVQKDVDAVNEFCWACRAAQAPPRATKA